MPETRLLLEQGSLKPLEVALDKVSGGVLPNLWQNVQQFVAVFPLGDTQDAHSLAWDPQTLTGTMHVMSIRVAPKVN